MKPAAAVRTLGALFGAALVAACARSEAGSVVLTFPSSAVGREAQVLAAQLARFEAGHPGLSVEQQRMPDAADQRHQIYVQRLNAHAGDPDVLQLDVIWTAEFAAAGWILPLDRFAPDTAGIFPAVLAADRYRGHLYALPWFVDVGMLYYRTDLTPGPPSSLEDLARRAARIQDSGGARYGFLWQGARYEGLVTVFLEHLGAFGGSILDDDGRVVVDSDAAVHALTFLRDEIRGLAIVPEAVLAWHEEETRFAFQNGEAVYLRNWPYAAALFAAPGSAVAGRFAVAPLPGTPDGHPTAALGGSGLAIDTWSPHPREAYLLIDYLTRPEQMLERAQVTGQLPPRRPLYDRPELARALAIPPVEARRIVDAAVARPVTPVYTQLSEILQIELHRALTGQASPRRALSRAAAEMRAVLARVGLGAAAGSQRSAGSEVP